MEIELEIIRGYVILSINPLIQEYLLVDLIWTNLYEKPFQLQWKPLTTVLYCSHQ